LELLRTLNKKGLEDDVADYEKEVLVEVFRKQVDRSPVRNGMYCSTHTLEA
jgi:hypothetical protein